MEGLGKSSAEPVNEDPEDRAIREGQEWFDSLSPEEQAILRQKDAETLARFQEPGAAEAIHRIFSRGTDV